MSWKDDATGAVHLRGIAHKTDEVDLRATEAANREDSDLAGISQTLTDGATISWNTLRGRIATVTLGGNRTMAAPTGLAAGTYILHVIQDGTGSRTITWNAVFKWSSGVSPTLSTTAGARDIFSLVSDGENIYGSPLLDVR